jgi:hypothetical protein
LFFDFNRFVRRYREWGTKEWQVVNPDNLAEQIATLYADRSIILFGDDDQNVPSTISQPSFVLQMLDLLQSQELNMKLQELEKEFPEK